MEKTKTSDTMYTTGTQLLRKAQREGYAVPHFNVSNLETIQAVVNACRKHKSPALIATSESAIKYASMEAIVNLYQTLVLKKDGIALHLDHGKDMKIIKKAIDSGYTSVMIDASHETFEENIRLTKQVVRWAKKKGVSVEAELGTIGGKEDYVEGKIKYTDVEQAKKFVERTHCDSLAVAIGTSHGAYKFPGESHLNIDLLNEINEKVGIPLVLHGASAVKKEWVEQANTYGAEIKEAHGVMDKDIKKAVKKGICKINIDSDLRLAFNASMRAFLNKNKESIDYRKMLSATREAMEQVMTEKIKLFGSAGKV